MKAGSRLWIWLIIQFAQQLGKTGATFSGSVLATQEAWNYWDSRDDR